MGEWNSAALISLPSLAAYTDRWRGPVELSFGSAARFSDGVVYLEPEPDLTGLPPRVTADHLGIYAPTAQGIWHERGRVPLAGSRSSWP